LAFLFRLIPKIGPLKILTFRTPTPETEKMFEASFNATLDRYRSLLTELEIEPAIESLEKCGRLSLCLVISGLFPQAGERMSWGFGGSGAYFVALEV
jgi:hypothetical protein